MERVHLTEEAKECLRADGRSNGVEVTDEDLNKLEEYLSLNPQDKFIEDNK